MIINDKIYLDYNATTPVLPEVAEAARQAMLDAWGNPGSRHQAGKVAAALFAHAGNSVAALINCTAKEIIFTSGGTESNNMVVYGVAEAMKDKGKHIITSCIEHPALLNPCLKLRDQGYDITFVKVNSSGVVNPEEVEAAIRPSTILVSIMLANNETGAIQPISRVGKICREKGVPFHTDAAQAAGKIPVDVKALDVDYLSIAGHKLYAPKGTGALYIKKGAPINPIFAGGGQQQGLRPGTEPVPLAAALGKACDIAIKSIHEEQKREEELRERLYEMLKARCNKIYRYSLDVETLPNTLCVSFPGIPGDEILMKTKKIMAATGAACHSGSKKISHVISAMDLPEMIAVGTLRLSIGRFSNHEQIEEAAREIAEVVNNS